MKAKDLTEEQRHLIIEHSSWVEGPRWAFGPGWLDRMVMEFNSEVVAVGWKPLRVVAQNTEKSWLRTFISFTLSGEAYVVGFFLEQIAKAMEAYNGV